jgi:Domain of unknown function (DUF4395)
VSVAQARPVPKMVDPRQPRMGQAITGSVLVIGFVLAFPPVLPALAAVLGAASLLGPRANPYAHLFRLARRTFRFGPPAELEEAAPPRFANTLGFLFLTAASIAYYGFGWKVAAWSLGLLVAALALLAAVTGLCVGCEAFVIGRRILTRGRVATRLTVPGRQVGVGG